MIYFGSILYLLSFPNVLEIELLSDSQDWEYLNSFADTVFFTNSGTESMECAVKMARRYHYENGAPERVNIITLKGSFGK